MQGELEQTRRQFIGLTGLGLLGGGLFAGTSGQLEAASLSSTFYNVRDYDSGRGAQASIQAAINAAANDGGGVVYLPAGTYEVNRLRLKQNVTLMGEGMGTVLQQKDVNKPLIKTYDISAFPAGVCCLRLRGGQGGSSSHGIYLATKSSGNGFTKPDGQHIIFQVFIENMAGAGIKIDQDCRGSLIEGCWIKGCSDGMSIKGSDTTISNCVSRTNSERGVFIEGGNVRLMNCKSYFNKLGGFVLHGSRCTLVACEAQDNWLYGFKIGKNYATLNGCIADSNQDAGFMLEGLNGYLGGLNLTGITAIGRDTEQAGKPWVGQAVGVHLRSNTQFKDCFFSGLARDNRDANYLVEEPDTLYNCIEQLLDGRLAAF